MCALAYLIQVSTHDHQSLDALHQLTAAAPQSHQQAVVPLHLITENNVKPLIEQLLAGAGHLAHDQGVQVY